MDEEWRAIGAEAARHLGEGRYAEAADGFERLVALKPDHADSWFNLGYARRFARRYEGALEAYREAIVRGMRGPEEAHLNRAVILADCLHQPDAARAELEEALRKKPDLLAGWLNLGNLAEDLGDADAATHAYRRALAIREGAGRAHARLAQIAVHRGEAGRAATELRQAASKVVPGTEDAAEVCFALGAALDATGDYPAAFAAVAEGNAISAALRPPARRYDRDAQERLVDSLIAAFPQRPTGDAGPDDDSIIFICGMFRSGSTLTEQVIARHPAVTSGGELEFLPALIEEQLQPYPESARTLPSERVAELRNSYLTEARKLFPDARRVTDKRPDNFLHIGLIKTLFPGARIVHTVRNPLDNILSVYFLYFAESIGYGDALDDIVHYYAQYRRLMAHWERIFGLDLFTVDYDRLVAEPAGTVEPLLDFLGLEWDEACLGSATASAVRTASNWQVRQPLHRRSSGRWHNYAQELESARQQLAGLGLLRD